MTLGAAGTSFPNLFASVVLARRSLGGMAVTNALVGGTSVWSEQGPINGTRIIPGVKIA